MYKSPLFQVNKMSDNRRDGLSKLQNSVIVILLVNFIVSGNSKQSSVFPLFIKKQGEQRDYEWEIRGKFSPGRDVKKKLKKQPAAKEIKI